METIGLIDIGSNTVRLVIYEIKKKSKDYMIILNTKDSVRLRNHVIDNTLSEEGIQKLFNVLKRFKSILKKNYKIDKLKLFATQTIRMVDNKFEVIDRVKEHFNWKIDLLTSEEEALFGFQGMNTYLPDQKEGIFVDLGGGSTELVYFKNGHPIHNHSFPFGSIVLRNMINHSIPTKEELHKLQTFLINEFDSIPWIRTVSAPLIVGGGSSRNLIRIDRFLTKRHESTHGYTIHFREINRIRQILMLLSIDEIENIEGFSSSRADIIIPSIYVFECLYEYINASYYVCTRTGLREGVLNDLLGA